MFKVFIILNSILCISLNTSQAQVIKYKAVIFITPKYENKKIEPVLSTACDFLVVVNFDKLKIHLYSNSEQDFDIIKKGETDEENKFTTYVYKCVDQVGEKCVVSYTIYEKGNAYDAALIFDYEKTMYIYYLKND